MTKQAYYFTVKMCDPRNKYKREFDAWLAGWSDDDIQRNYATRYPEYEGCSILKITERKAIPDFIELPKELRD